MNIIAIDIGNTNIAIGLFKNDSEKFVRNIAGSDTAELTETIKDAWQQLPFVAGAKEKKRNGVIALCSVKPSWTKIVKKIVRDELSEKIYEVGNEIPLPMDTDVDDPKAVGADRLVNAAAAFAVVQDAVVVADFGTAVTIDLVDEKGVFLGGVIVPGFAAAADSLKKNTEKLPKVKVSRPELPFGKNTENAINSGLYYSAIGTLETVVRKYAEHIGKWPQTIITGSAAELIKNDCEFVDSFVSDLAVKGVVLAYKNYIARR